MNPAPKIQVQPAGPAGSGCTESMNDIVDDLMLEPDMANLSENFFDPSTNHIPGSHDLKNQPLPLYNYSDTQLEDCNTMSLPQGPGTMNTNNYLPVTSVPTTASDRNSEISRSLSYEYRENALEMAYPSRASSMSDVSSQIGGRDPWWKRCDRNGHHYRPTPASTNSAAGPSESFTRDRPDENHALTRLEGKIDMAIGAIRKLYDSGICLELFREDTKLYADLEHMRYRLLNLIETAPKDSRSYS